MKRLVLFALLASFLAVSAVSFAQGSDFKTGKVVAVEKVESGSGMGHTTRPRLPTSRSII